MVLLFRWPFDIPTSLYLLLLLVLTNFVVAIWKGDYFSYQ